MPKSLHLLTAIRCVHWIACSYSVPQRFARTNIAKSVAKMASARNALTGMKPMMMANVNVSWLLVSTWFVVIASQNTLPRIFLHIIYKICITIFLYKFSRYVIDTTRWWLLPSLSEHLLILPHTGAIFIQISVNLLLRTGFNWLDILIVINMICNEYHKALYNDSSHIL